MRIKVASFSLLFFSVFTVAQAQEIDFALFYDQTTLVVDVLNTVNFGTVIATEDKEILLGDGDEGVIEITGLPFLDVMVTITPIQYLFLNGNDTCVTNFCRIAVNLEFVYTNTGIGYFAPGYDVNSKPFILDTARFQILERTSGPPGPPPVPTISGVSLPAAETAFIYIFGTITQTTNAIFGPYSNTVILNIVYN